MKKALYLSLLLLVLLSTYQVAIAQPSEEANQTAANQEVSRPIPGREHDPLVGSWFITVKSPTGETWNALGAFLDGGIYIGDQQGNISTTPIPIFGGAPIIQSDHYGSWVQLRRRQYAVTFQSLYYLGANDGKLIGTAEVRVLFRLNEAGDEYAGTFQGKIVDTDGNTVNTAEGTVTAKRIRVKPFGVSK